MKNLSKLPGWAKVVSGGGMAALVGGFGFSGWWSGEIAPVSAADTADVQFEVPWAKS
jgi:hypothetical protein